MKRMDAINMDAGGSAYRELCVWAMLEIQDAKDKRLIDKELAALLRQQVLQLRSAAGQLYDAADLPIPFFYVHFICLLTVLFLPLFAITQGISAGTGEEAHWVVDVVAGLVVFLQSIFIIGMRIVGQKVSDPFGEDLVDLSVMYFVEFTWTQSNRVLNSIDPSSSSLSGSNSSNHDSSINITNNEDGEKNNDDPDKIERLMARNRITIGKTWDDGTDQGLGVPWSDTKRKNKNKQKKKSQNRPNDKTIDQPNNIYPVELSKEDTAEDEECDNQDSSTNGSETKHEIGFENGQVS
jgi:hypothetical protein